MRKADVVTRSGSGEYDRDLPGAARSAPRDVRTLRADFLAFEHPMHGKPLAYLDSAAS